ncbi:uncharacterized protein M6B38_103105 [Iris pallida]|uniref:Reverse transcriptase zinc-binding domain-containing protein n=1 Tax=Iris pallida TaxID=29817 RepID=A0AAX6G6N4_IRIPA|nr:uncharacterized protein M6B38_103105 [Iris pallida]
MYTLAAYCPPRAVLRTIERMFAAFFWGSKDGVAKRSWLAWRFITLTKSEGGLVIKCLNDIMDAFSMKLWWKLRHGKGLWVELLKAKYFRKRHPCDAFMTSKCSHIWQRILRGRKLAEPFISLRLGRGEGSARCEDWIPGGPRLDSVAILPAEGVTSGTRRGTGRRTRGRSRTQARESADVEAADSTASQRVGTGELRRSARLAGRRVVLPQRTVTVRVLSDRGKKIRDSRARNSDNGGPAIRSFWTATGWDLSLFLGQFGVEAAGRLREANLTCTSDPDSLVWGDRKGSFTMAAAWRCCRTSHPTSSLFSNIWGKCIPTKWSILMWRVCHNRLPTDDILQKIGFHLASRCHCCQVGHRENLQHIFFHGDLALTVWSALRGFFKARMHSDFLVFLQRWWRGQDSHHRRSLAGAIIWVLWKNRNRHRYEGRDAGSDFLVREVKRQFRKSLSSCRHLPSILLWALE